MSTMKQIAQLAGVSRGTVDRVLNNRGNVNPGTEARIRQIAQALGYTPNRLGQTLAIKKKNLKFGYILFGSTASNPFFEEVVQAIREKAAELEEYGATVELRHTALDQPEQQVRLMEELVAGGAGGIAITPINHPLVAGKIDELAERGVPVVTVNSDLAHCGRIAYVGGDSMRSGETAAGLLGLITGGDARVGVVIGSRLVVCHAERVEGFRRHLERHFPGMGIVDTVCNNDDDLESFAVTEKLLGDHPEIDALFLAAAGVKGACRAVEQRGLAGKLRIISVDAVPDTRRLIEAGIIAATLGQQPRYQGAKPLELLLDYLGMGIPPARDCYYTRIEIMIRENLQQ